MSKNQIITEPLAQIASVIAHLSFTELALKPLITDAVKDFFKYGKMLKHVNHTFVSLVPKVEKPSSIQEYKPMSCCSFTYKIITKIMCNRLEENIGGR